MDYLEKAIEKLNKPISVSGKAAAVMSEVKDALVMFCEQEPEFAQAIVDNKNGLSECCNSIVKNIGNHISDVKLFARAVEFFFPGAKIDMQMKIDLIGDAAEKPKVLKLKFSDLLGD